MTLLDLKTWTEVHYPPDNPVVSFELKRPNRSQKRALQKLILPALGKVNAEETVNMTMAQKNEAAFAMWDILSEEKVLELFREYVRRPKDVEIDGNPITTAEDLLTYADDRLVLFVCTSLLTYSQLGDDEGKGSSSPSTSSPAQIESGPSVAASTESEGGTRPSTVEPTPNENASSGQAAGA